MKDNEEIIVPPFVYDYIDKVDGNGLNDFIKNCSDYQKAKKVYPEKFAMQSAHLQEFNRIRGQNKQLNYDEGLQRIDTEFRKNIYETAKKHGYKGPDPNQPSDKDFTKQGEKFQEMINEVKERKNQPEKQQQQQAPENEPLDREKLRAEFLEKMKQTKQQISQRQHDQGQEHA